LAAQSRSAPALAFTLAFVGAAVVPVYVVFLMPDLFNFAVIFFAYFWWLYKDLVVPRSRFLTGIWSDAIAAGLLAVATYSKPTHAPLMAPMVALLLWRRQFSRSVLVSVVFAVVAGALFGINAAITGEFNYQGG